jgi:hypothetical protein
MWALPEAAILYFTAFRLRVRWTFTVILGLTGLIGTPIDYYYEWIVEQNLISPVFAFMYIPLYVVMGLSADVSLMMMHPEWKPLRASLISSFIFTAVVLSATAFAVFSSIQLLHLSWTPLGSASDASLSHIHWQQA